MSQTVQWDALVVGAGPAGCAAAYDLAAAGRRVLLVDKAEFPRAKACAGGLTAKALRALRYPIDPVIRKRVHALTLEPAQGTPVTLARAGAPICAMTVREELDRFCLERTRERGVVFQRIGAIEAIVQSDEGVTLRTAEAPPFHARFLIGADGVHSRVRALAGPAEWFRTGFAVEANVPCRDGEIFPLTFDFAPVTRGYGWLFPRDNHVNVGLYVDGAVTVDPGNASDLPVNRTGLKRYIAARCGHDREQSAPVGQFLGMGASRYLPGPDSRVLLAGDAAGFVDPLTGEGIYGAIASGQAAAVAVLRALRAARHRDLRRGFGQAAGRLQSDLAVAEHAASRFYRDPSAGFRLLRSSLLRRAALHAYAEGASLGALLRLVHLARAVRLAER